MCDGALLPPLVLPALLLLLVWGLDPGTGSAPARAVPPHGCPSRPPSLCAPEASWRPPPACAARAGGRTADSARGRGGAGRSRGTGLRAGRPGPGRGRRARGGRLAGPRGPRRPGPDPARAAGGQAGGRPGGPRGAALTRLLSLPSAVGDAAADVEVVLPRRVRPDDVHLPPLPGGPAPRRRRRPRAPPAAPRPRPGERALLLHLPAFGRDLYLQLRRDLRFLSRGFEVEEAGAGGRRGRPSQLCFYSGRVLGHPGSLVSISACGAAGGLVLPASPPGLPVGLSGRRGRPPGEGRDGGAGARAGTSASRGAPPPTRGRCAAAVAVVEPVRPLHGAARAAQVCAVCMCTGACHGQHLYAYTSCVGCGDEEVGIHIPSVLLSFSVPRKGIFEGSPLRPPTPSD